MNDLYKNSNKGTGFPERDDDWKCIYCGGWHREKTVLCKCKESKGRPPKGRITRKEYREKLAAHKFKLDRWRQPKTQSNLDLGESAPSGRTKKPDWLAEIEMEDYN